MDELLIVEQWQAADMLGLMQQIGAVATGEQPETV